MSADNTYRDNQALGKAKVNFRRYSQMISCERYLEIGTWAGGSLFFVLERMRPEIAYAIDPYPGSFRFSKDVATRMGKRVRAQWAREYPHVRGGLIWESSHEVLPRKAVAWREFFDLIYVDGCHNGLDIFMDAAQTMRMVWPGGLLVFDDFGMKKPARRAALRLVLDTLQRISGGVFEVLFSNIHLVMRRTPVPWPESVQEEWSTVGPSMLPPRELKVGGRLVVPETPMEQGNEQSLSVL